MTGDHVGEEWLSEHTHCSRTASPPHPLSFGTVRRRDQRTDLSRFGQRLNSAMPVLTIGVSRRC